MRQVIATAEDNAFMADLLGELDVNIPSRPSLKTIKSESRRKTRVLSPPVSHGKQIFLPKSANDEKPAPMLSTPPLEHNFDDDHGFIGVGDDDNLPQSDPIVSSPAANAADRRMHQAVKAEGEEDDLMEIAQAVGGHKAKSVPVNMSGSRPEPKIVKPLAYPSPCSSSPTCPPATDVDASAWNHVTSKLNVLSSQESETASFGKLSIGDAVESDGSLHMFWSDYTEINGSLCLFGKVKDKKTGTHVSAFVKIDNILRKLFFLPRIYRQSE